MLTTVVLRQVFWLIRPLPAFPFDKEQWHISGKGAYPGFNRDRNYSGGTAPVSHGIPY
jgi:hypothetical protein